MAKRAKPESGSESEQELTWDNSQVEALNAAHVLQLLRNRGVKNDALRDLKKKQDKVKYLCDNTDIELKDDEIDEFTVKQIIPELALRGLSLELAKKHVLQERLRSGKNEVESAEEPPKKRQRTSNNGRGRKKLAENNKVWYVTYAPEDIDDEGCEARCAGIYSKAKQAYTRATDLILEDIERKKKKESSKIKTDISKLNATQYKKKYETVSKAVKKIFEAGKEPYADVTHAKIDEDIDL